MRHIIITRYGLAQSDPAWYHQRLPFFKRYLKALQTQTNPNFTVLLLIDQHTPPESIKACQKLLPDNRFAISTRPLKQPFPETLIQTRIDSDDLIAEDFVDQVQKNISPGQMLNFINGYIAMAGQLYKIRYTSNMFLSIWDTKSCYAHDHTVMHKKYPVTNITGRPMWIHVEHPASSTWLSKSWTAKIPLLWRQPYKHIAFFPAPPDARFPHMLK